MPVEKQLLEWSSLVRVGQISQSSFSSITVVMTMVSLCMYQEHLKREGVCQQLEEC